MIEAIVELIFTFCGSSVFSEFLLQILVPVCAVFGSMSLIGVLFHGKFV